MLDYILRSAQEIQAGLSQSQKRGRSSWRDATGQKPIKQKAYLALKRFMDLGLSIILLPFVGLIATGLLLLNPRFNPGPLMFTQDRLGKHGVPFRIYKFRTMSADGLGERHATEALDAHRIGALGAWLRQSRFDELPQILNILRGEMSFIGPRPDQLEHAEFYIDHVPHYAGRFAVRPGISGLAQVTLGYAEGLAQTSAKAQRDLVYVRRASFLLDAQITWLTLVSLVAREGR